MTEARSQIPEDVKAISATFTRLEFLLVILYIVFGSIFVWYLVENFINYYGMEESVWGLPRFVAGSLMIAIEWIIVNFTVFAIYYTVIKRKLKSLRGK
uniref:DUF4282 domain-containing protein n=1 Tax=Ignisphaera aggregans TaxID=334771 RepID=A0A7C5TGK6_9CREN